MLYEMVEMRRIKRIDPKVDCVFKAILGSEHHEHLLIHFLNAVLESKGGRPIVAVQIRDPYNPKNHERDKLSIVDVKARDDQGRFFQIEMQISVRQTLRSRILHMWSKLFSNQLKKGEGYELSSPIHSIWILTGILFPKTESLYNCFMMCDIETGQVLNDKGMIHVLELKKLGQACTINPSLACWLYFFAEGENLDADNLPAWMETKEMTEALRIRDSFAFDDEQWMLYERRLDAERAALADAYDHRQVVEELKQTKVVLAQERAEKEQERAEKEQLRLDNERLKNLLNDRGMKS